MGLFDMAKSALGDKELSSLFSQFSGQGPMIDLMKVVQGQAGIESLNTIFSDADVRDQLLSQIMQFTGIQFDALTNSFVIGDNSYHADAEGLITFVKAFLGK